MFRDIPLAAVSKARRHRQGGVIWSCRQDLACASPCSLRACADYGLSESSVESQNSCVLRMCKDPGPCTPQEGTKGYKNRGSGRPTPSPAAQPDVL